jgi:hypothetical protein
MGVKIYGNFWSHAELDEPTLRLKDEEDVRETYELSRSNE